MTGVPFDFEEHCNQCVKPSSAMFDVSSTNSLDWIEDALFTIVPCRVIASRLFSISSSGTN